MKTIEQKAKDYDEAVKVIKDNLDALNEITETGAEVVNIQSIKNCFYRAFPELKESDDEKIRKTLIEMFSNVGTKDWGGIPTEEFIAWLEKQGSQALSNSSNIGKDEQKPAWSEEDDQSYEDVVWCINKALQACHDENEAGTCWFAQRFINSVKQRLGGGR